MRKTRCSYKRIYFIAAIIVALFAAMTFGVLGIYPRGGAKSSQPPKQEAAKPLSAEEHLSEQTAKLLAEMPLDAKVGQMIVAGIHDTEINDDSRRFLSNYKFGGIILFDRNMQSKEQVKKLTADLQKYTMEQQKSSAPIPLFIALDEEGGLIARMRDSLSPPPSAQSIVQTGLTEAAKWTKYTADELKSLGVNLNFAPAADVGLGDERSYSDKPEVVTEFIREIGKTYTANNFLYTLKHFPGIGRGASDSHFDSVTVNAQHEELEKNDLSPFRTMIAGFDNDTFLVMVSHLTYPALDSAPASMSQPIVRGLLREKLGFKGVVITDDMEKGAISNHYGLGKAAVEAVKAGVDIVLVCHEYEHETAAYDAVLKAVKNGEISESRIDESVKRILRVKLKNL